MPPSPQTTPQQQTEKKDVTVYVTRAAKRYRRAGCSSLRSSSIPIPLLLKNGPTPAIAAALSLELLGHNTAYSPPVEAGGETDFLNKLEARR